MFTDQLAVLQIVMFGQKLIESLDFIGPHKPYSQVDEDLLFIDRGIAKAGWFFMLHGQQHKKMRTGCPAKSFNQFAVSILPAQKNAPYRNARTRLFIFVIARKSGF